MDSTQVWPQCCSPFCYPRKVKSFPGEWSALCSAMSPRWHFAKGAGILQKVFSGKLALCGDTCRGRAADEKREWKKVAVKFAYLFPFGNRLRGRVLSQLVGKKNFCRGPPCFDFRGALGPPDGGGAITAGVQGTQSHAAASAAPIYCFHLLAFIFASHISCQQHPRPGRPGHKTGSHWPPPPRRLEINIEGWRGGLEARRGGPGQGRDLKNCLQNCLQNCFVNAGGVGVGVETFLPIIGISICLLSVI